MRYKIVCTMALGAMLLLTLEAGLRFRAYLLHGTAQTVAGIYEPHERLGRVPRPHAELLGLRHKLHINQWGFRGAELKKQKPANTVRVAVIGDSTVFGQEASSDDTTWVARMRQTLQARLDAAAGASRAHYWHCETINAGVPGYGLAQSMINLRERVLAFDPDVVVVMQVANDITAAARKAHTDALQRDAAQGNKAIQASVNHWSTVWLQRNSLTVNLIRKNTAGLRHQHTPEPARLGAIPAASVRAYGAELTALVAYARERGCRVVLCTLPRAFGDTSARTAQHQLAASALSANPWLTLAGLNDSYDAYNAEIRRVASFQAVALADLAGEIPRRSRCFHDAAHLNDEGAKLAGRAVAGVISDLIGLTDAASVTEMDHRAQSQTQTPRSSGTSSPHERSSIRERARLGL